MEHGVDLAIWAHEHSYERMWPMYNHRVVNGSDEGDPYHNPKGLVHVTTGSAGCSERHDDFVQYMPDYTAFRSTDYGYSRLHVLNKTHLHMEQVSDDQVGNRSSTMNKISNPVKTCLSFGLIFNIGWEDN